MSDNLARVAALDTITARSVLRYLNNHVKKKFDPKAIVSMRAADTKSAITANYSPEDVGKAIDAVQVPTPEAQAQEASETTARSPLEIRQELRAELAKQMRDGAAAEGKRLEELRNFCSPVAKAPKATHFEERNRLLAELDDLESRDLDARIDAAVEKAFAAYELARDGI